ncbi:MAG: peptidoglycan D,D-transpeptidase FtsI family protein [Lachnospiraceae bacterium]|jgi:stage V sporulation protein D (sporulation-specific penicillin-binding protein)
MSRRQENNINDNRYGNTKVQIKKKLAGLFIAVLLVLAAISIRITFISASNGDKYSKAVLAQSQSQYSSTVIPYKRGEILDANGNTMAASKKVYNLILDCYVNNTNEDYYEPTVTALAQFFDVDENYIRNLLNNEETSQSRYQVLQKEVDIEEKKAFEDYLNETDGLSKEEILKRSNVKGVWFEDEYKRYYPYNDLACDVIGFTNSGNTADWGLEGYYNYYLNGVNGRKYGYYSSDSSLGQSIEDPIDGCNLVTTIDVNVQMIVEKYIKQYMEDMSDGPFGKSGADNVGVIIMDPGDGSVLAMASSGSYDLNNPRDLSSYYNVNQINAMSDTQKVEALESIWRNYCISDSFEPGSTFKPVTVAAALETGAISGSETFYCDGSENVSGTSIKCSDTDGHGEETVSDLIKNSCNDGIMKIAALLGIDDFTRYQDIFNFGTKTGIDLSGEAEGILHSSSNMGAVDLATSSFGQGFTCTMIQEISAVSALVNGGDYYKPRLVSKLTDSNGSVVKNIPAQIEKQAVSKDTSDQVRSYMKASVDEGTALYSKVNGYSSGGKTGTAQKIPRGNGKYLVSFIGFWPYEQPELVCYVVIDEPNTSNQANSAYAQVLARDIMSEVLPYMNIYPDEPLRTDYQAVSINDVKEMDAETGADTNIPEVSGYGEAEGYEDRSGAGYTNEDTVLRER